MANTRKRIGTIIHGALGDCYEQLCAIKILKERDPSPLWIAFFAIKDRMQAMQHFELDMIDELYLIDELGNVRVDEFFQFQIMDKELHENIFRHLSTDVKVKFDFSKNIKPWHYIRCHDYSKSGLELDLSEAGKAYLPVCMEKNGVDGGLFGQKLTVGFLWRYRAKTGAVKGYFQKHKDWILRTKSALFNKLIAEYDAHIFVCGMKRNDGHTVNDEKAVFVQGEYIAKYTNDELDVPGDHVTYLKGLGYAAEMEIISHCDISFLMPSGFSEPIWMKRMNPVLMVDPPPVYMAKMFLNRMPLFDNNKLSYAYYNTCVSHTPDNVLSFVKKHNLLPERFK